MSSHPTGLPSRTRWRQTLRVLVAGTLCVAPLFVVAVLASRNVGSVAVDTRLSPPAPLALAVGAPPNAPRFADFVAQMPSAEARHIADWVADSHDNGGTGFVIVDKHDARVYVFDADARLRGSSPVLLGAALGDDSVPGIGSRPIADVQPFERTTPAGRFVAEHGHNAGGEDIVWVDYEAAVSMHRVRTTNPKERRLQRLASANVADNRISYGCINVPVAFYDSHIAPLFAAHSAIVYVLPETRAARQLFTSYDVGARYALLSPQTPRPSPLH